MKSSDHTPSLLSTAVRDGRLNEEVPCAPVSSSTANPPSSPASRNVSYQAAKRLFDVLCAGVGLLVLLPAGLIIALLIKLSDSGPIFFRQTRIGQFGKAFRIWKFRSMVLNADTLGGSLTKEEDPRITRIGRLLRKAKLDELPQLWNVLVGEMSFVGPRPEVARYVEMYTPEQREILNYRPGITDLATMLFRNEETLLRGTGDIEGFYVRYCLPKKIELNLDYAKSASLPHDVWIIIQTLCPYWLGVLVLYSAVLFASLWAAFELRSDFSLTSANAEAFKSSLPWMIAPQLAFLFWRGQFRGLMSYFSIPEMRRTLTALAAAFFAQVALCYLFGTSVSTMRSIILMDFVLSFFGLCGLRMGFRQLRERSSVPKTKSDPRLWRVAIIGTGKTATNLALDFSRGENAGRRVVAFFDDNPRTWHKRPHDIPVVGMPECLLNPEWRDKFDEIIVALPDETSERLEELRSMLKQVPIKASFANDSKLLEPLNS